MEDPTVDTSLAFTCDTAELDFAEISRLLGREADETRSLFAPTKTGHPRSKPCSVWQFSTGPLVLNSIDEGVTRLFELPTAQWDTVAALCSERNYEPTVTSQVRIYDWDDRPFVELSSFSVAQLQRLGARWQLDWVDLSR